MNETQRQLLADEIDSLERTVQRYKDAIAKLDKQRYTKSINLAKVEVRLAELKKGIDW